MNQYEIKFRNTFPLWYHSYRRSLPLSNNSNNSNWIQLHSKSVNVSSSSSKHGWTHEINSIYVVGNNGATISEPCIHHTRFINFRSLQTETLNQTAKNQLFVVKSTSWWCHTFSKSRKSSGQSSHSSEVQSAARSSWRQGVKWIWSTNRARSSDLHLASLHHLGINVIACYML